MRVKLVATVKLLVSPDEKDRLLATMRKVNEAYRRSQASFVCTGCGFADNADHVGARNIASRAEVIRPIVANVRLGIEHVPSSPQPCQLQSSGL